jgi:hypothetical protein
VLVIGNVMFGDVVELLSSAEKTQSREVNSVVYTVQEFQNKVKSNHRFFKSVLEGEKIFLIGDDNELNAFSGAKCAILPGPKCTTFWLVPRGVKDSGENRF